MYYSLNNTPATAGMVAPDWNTEVRRMENQGQNVVDLSSGPPPVYGTTAANHTLSNVNGSLHMQNGMPPEMIENPASREEVHRGSIKALMQRNIGNYIVATFLVGTQNLTSWEGVLYDVGNDYLTIYQPARDRYIVNDMYSLKFVEFYDTERQQACDAMLRQTQWRRNGSSSSEGLGLGMGLGGN